MMEVDDNVPDEAETGVIKIEILETKEIEYIESLGIQVRGNEMKPLKTK